MAKTKQAFSKKQKQFYRESMAKRMTWNFQTGAVSSGKTYLDFYKIPVRIKKTTGKGLIVFIGNSQSTLERNIFEPMRKLWGDALVGNIRSNNKIKMFGHDCYAIGANAKNAVDRIQGMTIEYAYGDEVATWAEEVFKMLLSRLRTDNSVFDGTANPEHNEHWLKKFLDANVDLLVQNYTIDDNPFLSPRYVKNLKEQYSGTVYYDRYILGLWVAASGLIYPQFANREDDFLYEVAPWQGRQMTGVRHYISVDYGTINPMVFLKWRIHENVAYIVDEFYFDSRKERRQKTDEEYYQDLEQFCEGDMIDRVFVDPSAASFIETIRRKRRFSVVGAENDVANGIRVLSSMLSGGRIKIHKDCLNTRREMKAYLWDNTKKDGKEVPIKTDDHIPDAMRYFSSSHLSRVLRWVDWNQKRKSVA